MTKMNEEQVEELVSVVREFNEEVAEFISHTPWEFRAGRTLDTASQSSIMLSAYGTLLLGGAMILMNKGCPPHVLVEMFKDIALEVVTEAIRTKEY